MKGYLVKYSYGEYDNPYYVNAFFTLDAKKAHAWIERYNRLYKQLNELHTSRVENDLRWMDDEDQYRRYMDLLDYKYATLNIIEVR